VGKCTQLRRAQYAVIIFIISNILPNQGIDIAVLGEIGYYANGRYISTEILVITLDLRAPLPITCRGTPCGYPRVIAVIVFNCYANLILR
jgi:hypothetical protein